MIEKTCRCGKSKKNFKVDIGPFYIDECCEKEGYDHTGKKKVTIEDLGLTTEDVQTIEQAQNLEVQDEGEQPDPQEEQSSEEDDSTSEETEDLEKEVEEVIQETIKDDKATNKKTRKYNRNGQVKIKKETDK